MRLMLIGTLLCRQDNSEGLDFSKEGAFMDAEFPSGSEAIPLIPPQSVGQKNGLQILKC